MRFRGKALKRLIWLGNFLRTGHGSPKVEAQKEYLAELSADTTEISSVSLSPSAFPKKCR